jgi:hypothetical protein
MGYDQHDLFRDRLNALPLSAGRRGIAAMVLVEIVRWMPNAGSECSRTAEELGDLLKLRPGDVLIALGTLESLGVIEQSPQGPATGIRQGPTTGIRQGPTTGIRQGLSTGIRQGLSTGIRLRPMSAAKSSEQLRTEIAEAIQNHSAWKRRLRHAIESGTADVAVEDVARADLCAFGQWLAGPSFGDADRDGPYQIICQRHTQFHQVAAATLRLALSGRTDEAERAMSAGGAYSRASLRLTSALIGWRGSVAR